MRPRGALAGFFFFFWSYQVVVWFNAEEISEVAECHRGVGLEAEVGVVVRWCQVAPLAGTRQEIKSTEKMIRESLSVLHR